uniref:Uncharacterized protein n=1 Tax=Arundo donax TaxID=35708 RepID=A0A0A9EC81_ARUDO
MRGREQRAAGSLPVAWQARCSSGTGRCGTGQRRHARLGRVARRCKLGMFVAARRRPRGGDGDAGVTSRWPKGGARIDLVHRPLLSSPLLQFTGRYPRWRLLPLPLSPQLGWPGAPQERDGLTCLRW